LLPYGDFYARIPVPQHWMFHLDVSSAGMLRGTKPAVGG
jgi:hypothetical protein